MTHFLAKLPHTPNPIDNPQLIDYRNAVHYLTRKALTYRGAYPTLNEYNPELLSYKRVVARLEWQAGVVE